MALLKTAWANLQDGLGNRFSWSHVKAIFYNYAEHKLLSTKLDEMDALIDAKIAKAMMSSVQVNDESKVPTSALAYSMSQEISQNEQNIATLNSNLSGFSVDLKPSGANCDDLISGIWLACDASNGPGSGWWMIISCGDSNTRKQVAYVLDNQPVSRTRNFIAGSAGTWSDLK